MTGWRWSFLIKTKAPQLVDQPWEVSEEDREADLARLAAVVNPTIAQMQAVLEGSVRRSKAERRGRYRWLTR